MEKLGESASANVELQAQLSRRFVAGREKEAPLPLRIFFYIDALNLYYGALRHAAHRWLDIGAFCDAILRESARFNTAVRTGAMARLVQIDGINLSAMRDELRKLTAVK